MTTKISVRSTIERVLRKVAEDGGKTLDESFGDQTVLLQSGLDSLDFAIIVARLEREFEADPFSALVEAVYPRTYADLVAIYERYFETCVQP